MKIDTTATILQLSPSSADTTDGGRTSAGIDTSAAPSLTATSDSSSQNNVTHFSRVFAVVHSTRSSDNSTPAAAPVKASATDRSTSAKPVKDQKKRESSSTADAAFALLIQQRQSSSAKPVATDSQVAQQAKPATSTPAASTVSASQGVAPLPSPTDAKPPVPKTAVADSAPSVATPTDAKASSPAVPPQSVAAASPLASAAQVADTANAAETIGTELEGPNPPFAAPVVRTSDKPDSARGQDFKQQQPASNTPVVVSNATSDGAPQANAPATSGILDPATGAKPVTSPTHADATPHELSAVTVNEQQTAATPKADDISISATTADQPPAPPMPVPEVPQPAEMPSQVSDFHEIQTDLTLKPKNASTPGGWLPADSSTPSNASMGTETALAITPVDSRSKEHHGVEIEASLVPETATGDQMAPALAPGQQPLPASVPLQALPDHIVEMVQRLDHTDSSQQSSVVLRLDPPELGRVNVHVSVSNDIVSIRMVASDDTARQAIERQMNDLQQSLSNQGLTLSQCQVDSNGSGQQAFDRGMPQRTAEDFQAIPMATRRSMPFTMASTVQAPRTQLDYVA